MLYKLHIICITALLAATPLSAYIQPKHVDSETWNQLAPYFLPENHPIKPKLDSLFSHRITENTQSLQNAGFLRPKPRSTSSTVVSKHPQLKGVIVKLYTDDNPLNEAHELFMRIVGAELTRVSIHRHKYQSLLTVPKKWIYPLPENPAPIGPFRKNFILVAEDMNIMRREANFTCWKSNAVTKNALTAIYVVIQEVGLEDSLKPSNIPFTKQMKFAFIDTPVFHRWPINFDKLTVHLSPSMQKHWRHLISSNAP